MFTLLWTIRQQVHCRLECVCVCIDDRYLNYLIETDFTNLIDRILQI